MPSVYICPTAASVASLDPLVPPHNAPPPLNSFACSIHFDMSNNNRHKRQKSSANPPQFHLEDNSQYHSQDDSQLSHTTHSRYPLQLLRGQGRFPANILAHTSQPHGNYSIPTQESNSSEAVRGYQGHHTANLPQHAVAGQEPFTYFNVPQDFSYSGNFEQDLSSLGAQFMVQPGYAPQQLTRPQPSTWASAPQMSGHNKNISISSHFDMFSLSEPHYEAPTNRQMPTQTHFPATNILESSRLPYIHLGRMSSAPPDHSQVQHALSLHETTRTAPLYGHEEISHFEDNSTRMRLLRNIVNVDAFNLNSYLLSVLKELIITPPLDEFYNMLYGNEHASSVLKNETLAKIDKSNAVPTSESMEILQLILGVFRDPQTLLTYIPTLDMSRSKLASMNFRELLRSFLAMKILFDSLVEVNAGSSSLDLPTLPRLSIYKVYYILCQMLMLKYPTESNSNSMQQNLILGQSKLGKLIKLVYPNVLSKRLGRRGESKYNYLGVIWNPNIVDKEILDLCEEDLAKLADDFANKKKLLDNDRRKNSRQLSLTSRRISIPRTQGTGSPNLPPILANESRVRPLVTFIHSQTKFPLHGLSPLSLVSEPDNIDLHTSWFGSARHHSLMILREFNIDLLIIRNVLLDKGKMASDENWLFKELAAKTDMILSSSFREDKEHLHLFLAVAIELLPTIIIHDPMKDNGLSLMKKNLQQLGKQLGPRFADTFLIEASDINAFVAVSKRMVHITELLDSLCLTTLDSTLLKDMRGDLDRFSLTSEDSYIEDESPLSRIRELITQGMLRTLNSYQPLQDEDGSHMSSERVIENVQRDANSILRSFHESLTGFFDDISIKNREAALISPLEYSMTMSRHLVNLVHSVVLADAMAEHYPIVVIKDMVTYISNQVLRSIYEKNLNQRGTGSLHSTFRLWWILATYCQEYFGLLSELVGLHESLT